MNIDGILNDIREILEVNDKKCLIIYGNHGTDEPVNVKFNSTLLDLSSMASAAVLCLATELAKEYGYDSSEAMELAVKSVEDRCSLLLAKNKSSGYFDGSDDPNAS